MKRLCEPAVLVSISGASRNNAGELPAPLLQHLFELVCQAAPNLPGTARFVSHLAHAPCIAKALYYMKDYRQSCITYPITFININNCKDHSKGLAVYLPNST